MKELIKVEWRDNILSKHYDDNTVDLKLKPIPYIEEEKSKSSLISKLLEMIKNK